MTESPDLDIESDLVPTPESQPEFAAMPGLVFASALGEQSAKAATDVGNAALVRSPTASPADVQGRGTPGMGNAARVRSMGGARPPAPRRRTGAPGIAHVTYSVSVRKGDLGPTVKRTPRKVLKGDQVTVTASVSGFSDARRIGVQFLAVWTDGLPIEHKSWQGPNRYQWAVRATDVGQHRLVFWGHGPGGGLGLDSISFDVLSDVADFHRALTQAQFRLERKFNSAMKKLNDASTAYNAAHTNHVNALKEADRQERLVDEVLLGVLFAGLGGFAGGMTGAVMKTAWEKIGKDVSKTVLAEGGTDLAKDVVKFATRNARKLVGTGVETTGDSTALGQSIGASVGERAPVREDPLTMLTSISAKLYNEKVIQYEALDALMTELRTAAAQDANTIFDEDPAALAARPDPVIDTILKGTTASRVEYLESLWGAWIETYGFVDTDYGIANRTRGKIKEQIEKAAKDCGSTYDAWLEKYAGARMRRWEEQERARRRDRPQGRFA